jgi:hypothetical protein
MKHAHAAVTLWFLFFAFYCIVALGGDDFEIALSIR